VWAPLVWAYSGLHPKMAAVDLRLTREHFVNRAAAIAYTTVFGPRHFSALEKGDLAKRP
jgi:hypothetical protein